MFAKKKKGEERISLINKIIAGKEGVSLTVKDRVDWPYLLVVAW